MAVDAGSIYSEVRLKLGNLAADISTVNSKLDMMYRNSEKRSKGFGEFWKGAFQTAFGFGTIQIIQRVIGAMREMIGIFSGFQQSMKNVQSVTGAVGDEFRQLNDAAKEAGETTRFTAREAADALYYLGSAGFSARQSIEALDGVLQLAGATQSDLASTSETVASIISQYSLDAAEAGRVSNVFAAAIGNSQATMEKLSTSFRQVGPVAAGFGYSLEETVGALQQLYNAGFQGQQAGRALKSALADLASPTKNMQQIFGKLGISLDKVNPEINDMASIIDTLAESGISTADIIDAFGKVAGPQMAVLIEKGGAALRKYTTDVTNTNAAAEAYRIQNDSLAGSIDFLRSKLESTAIAIFEKMEPGMRDLIDSFIQFLDAVRPVGEFLGNILNIFLKLAALSTKGISALFKFLLQNFRDLKTPIEEAAEGLEKVSSAIRRAGELKTTADNLTELTNRYNELQKKTNRTKEEQDELQSVIIEIEKIVPDAVTRFDEYGNAIEISGSKSKEAARQMLLAREAILKNSLTQLKASESIYKRIARQNKADAEAAQKNRNRLVSESTLAEARLATLDEFRTKYNMLVGDIDDLIGPYATFAAQSEAFNKVLAEMDGRLKDVGVNLNNVGRYSGENPLEEIDRQMNKANKTLDQLQRSLEKPTEAEQLYEDAKKKLDEIAALEKELRDIQKGINNLNKIDPVDDDAPGKVDDLNDGLEETGDNAEDAAEKTDEAAKKTDELAESNVKLKSTIKEVGEVYKITTEEILNDAARLADALSNVFTSIADSRIDELDRQMQAELEAAGLAEETEKERLERELQEAIKAGNIEKQNEIQNNLDKLAIEEEYEKKKAQVQYRAEMAAWYLKLGAIGADTAAAIMKATASAPWPINLIPIGFASVMGGLQLAAAIAQKPKPPAFKTGGLYIDRTAGTEGRPAILHNREMVLNPDQQANLFNSIDSGEIGNGERVTNLTVIIQQDSVETARATAKVFNDGIITLNPDRALRST